MIILGIETSCDETAAAVVRDGRQVLSSAVYSQIAQHEPYGGVVPEIASRSHVELLPSILAEAVGASGLDWSAIDAVAVTRGPGLASSLLIGLAAAKALALRLHRPMIGINHLRAHLHSVFLGDGAPRHQDVLPAVALMVSGGHTALVRMDAVDSFVLLGQTLDDAAGEALDKGASLLGLGYPGGPAIEKAALGGDPSRFDFPRGLRRAASPEQELCFSFSGLKTALRYFLEKHPEAVKDGGLRDVAASYQEAVVAALVQKLEQALQRERTEHFFCVGGVARNRRLRQKLEELAQRRGRKLWLAAPDFCTDNAAMVAASAAHTRPLPPAQAALLDCEPNLSVEVE